MGADTDDEVAHAVADEPGIWLEAFTKAANGVDVDSGTAAGDNGQPSHGHQDNEGDRT